MRVEFLWTACIQEASSFDEEDSNIQLYNSSQKKVSGLLRENEQAPSVSSISFDMNRIKIYKINARNWCQPLEGLKAGRN